MKHIEKLPLRSAEIHCLRHLGQQSATCAIDITDITVLNVRFQWKFSYVRQTDQKEKQKDCQTHLSSKF